MGQAINLMELATTFALEDQEIYYIEAVQLITRTWDLVPQALKAQLNYNYSILNELSINMRNASSALKELIERRQTDAYNETSEATLASTSVANAMLQLEYLVEELGPEVPGSIVYTRWLGALSDLHARWQFDPDMVHTIDLPAIEQRIEQEEEWPKIENNPAAILFEHNPARVATLQRSLDLAMSEFRKRYGLPENEEPGTSQGR
jgi:hypothetical protein